jgi:hypothetical protein
MHSSLKLLLLCALVAPAHAQDRHDWQSLAKLQAGDSIRLTLKTGPVDGTFQSWTPQQVTAGSITAKREDVLKIERNRPGGTRAKHAAIGALIGFGGGFAIGAGVTGWHAGQFGPCVSRGEGDAIAGAVGAVIGAGIGALLPHHARELIYTSR